jgi:hypothetical protein
LGKIIVRIFVIFIFFASAVCGFAVDVPRIEVVRRDGLDARLRFVNAGERELFVSPYYTLEEFHERPACDDCAKGWIATRPRRLASGSDLVRVAGGESLEFDSPLSPLRPTRVSVFVAGSATAKKGEFQSFHIEFPAPAKK